MAAPHLDVVGVIVSDMEASIAFYRRLGVKFPEPHDPEGHGHVEATLDGGIRFALDTEDTIRSFDPGWAPPVGGHRIAVAFLFDSPNSVDETFAELVSNGARPYKNPGTPSGVSATRRSTIRTATWSTSSPRSADRSAPDTITHVWQAESAKFAP